MEYISLYRKFRPLKFNEIVGQEHITQTLKNEIIANRVGHAYLFNGGRGTGKTSAAKILARAVNCLNPKDGEPCNECEMCKQSIAGSLTDIVEMDAASNNSVEDVRAIRDEVSFLPTVAKYRVYIIDEVHMLSTGAFNALLKTLEEPPAHVKFILATAEPQRLPATILSRCQRFDFKKISEEDIIKRLKVVCKECNIDITEEAMETIAVLAEGAMRDALSILERCMQEQSKITAKMVKELVGIPQTDSVANIVENLLDKETIKALENIEEILNSGKDIESFVWELTKYLKDMLVVKSKGELRVYSQKEKERIAGLAEKADSDWIVSAIYELSNLANQIKWASQKKVIFEVAVIKLCMDKTSLVSGNDEIKNLEKKIKALEDKINSGVTVEKKPSVKTENKANVEETKKPKIEPKPILVGEELKNWPEIINKIKQSGKISVYTNLLNSKATQVNDMTVGITFPNGLTRFGKSILEQSENMNEIVKQVSMALGKTMRVRLVENEEDAKKINRTTSKKSELENLGIPINVIEE